jgi:hypothetical protein
LSAWEEEDRYPVKYMMHRRSCFPAAFAAILSEKLLRVAATGNEAAKMMMALPMVNGWLKALRPEDVGRYAVQCGADCASQQKQQRRRRDQNDRIDAILTESSNWGMVDETLLASNPMQKMKKASK